MRRKGFDHTTQGAYAAAAGVAKALALSRNQIANAIAISGTANVALRVTRTGALSHWKGLVYPNTAMAATHAALLAAHGITGPQEVFEGNKGFMDSIAGRFEIELVEGESRTGTPHHPEKAQRGNPCAIRHRRRARHSRAARLRDQRRPRGAA